MESIPGPAAQPPGMTPPLRYALQIVRCGYMRFTGMSMVPVLREGDLVCPSPYNQSLPAPGDLVAFFIGDEVCVHRVMAVSADSLLTRGDANRRFDAPVPMCSVLGLVDGLYDPLSGKVKPFNGLRAVWNTAVRLLARLAGRSGWLAWCSSRTSGAWKKAGAGAGFHRAV